MPEQRAEPESKADRRARYRLKVDTKVLVSTGPKSEVATITNMTRNGIYFRVFGDYQPGMQVQLTFPYDPSKPSVERPQTGQVVRVEALEGSIKKGVAVKLLNVFLKP